jgi:hypothetical protein
VHGAGITKNNEALRTTEQLIDPKEAAKIRQTVLAFSISLAG